MPGIGVPPLLRWAQRVQALAQTGLTYARDPYEGERYPAIPQMSAATPVWFD